MNWQQWLDDDNTVTLCRLITKRVFEKTLKNMDSMEKGLQFVESYFTDKNFPGWEWRIYTRGTFQNKPYFEIDGNTSMNSTQHAKISLKYTCCNKTGPVLVIQSLKPKLNYCFFDNEVLTQATM